MMLRYIIVLLLVLVSCNDKEKDKSYLTTHGIYKDTVITLKNIESSGSGNSILTKKYAETVLYRYFKQKEGYITTSEMEDYWTEIDNPDSKWKKEIGFVDIRYININYDGFKDAIVNYYDFEPYANGNV